MLARDDPQLTRSGVSLVAVSEHNESSHAGFFTCMPSWREDICQSAVRQIHARLQGLSGPCSGWPGMAPPHSLSSPSHSLLACSADTCSPALHARLNPAPSLSTHFLPHKIVFTQKPSLPNIPPNHPNLLRGRCWSVTTWTSKRCAP